jgi:hypothetical protein
MSMVPEEGSLTPSESQTKSPIPKQQQTEPIARPRKRTTETLSNIKTIGNIVSASSDQINKLNNQYHNQGTLSLPRRSQSQQGMEQGILKPVSQPLQPLTTFGNQRIIPFNDQLQQQQQQQQETSHSELTLTIKRIPSYQLRQHQQQQQQQHQNQSEPHLYKSHDSGISSNGFHTMTYSPNYTKNSRGESVV